MSLWPISCITTFFLCNHTYYNVDNIVIYAKFVQNLCSTKIDSTLLFNFQTKYIVFVASVLKAQEKVRLTLATRCIFRKTIIGSGMALHYCYCCHCYTLIHNCLIGVSYPIPMYFTFYCTLQQRPLYCCGGGLKISSVSYWLSQCVRAWKTKTLFQWTNGYQSASFFMLTLSTL